MYVLKGSSVGFEKVTAQQPMWLLKKKKKVKFAIPYLLQNPSQLPQGQIYSFISTGRLTPSMLSLQVSVHGLAFSEMDECESCVARCGDKEALSLRRKNQAMCFSLPG